MSMDSVTSPSPSGAAGRPIVLNRSAKLALKAQQDRKLKEKQVLQQAAALAYITMHRSRTIPEFIGVRARIKTPQGDVPRPTMVAFRSLDGIVRDFALETPQDEMDFAAAVFPTAWRVMTEDEIRRFADFVTGGNEAEPPPFLPWHIKQDVKRSEAKTLLTAEDFKALPAKQKSFTLVPTDFDGFMPTIGDRMLIPHGGEGNYLAAAAYRMIPPGAREELKGAVVRVTTAFLKQQRDLATVAETQALVATSETTENSSSAPKKRGRKPKVVKATPMSAMERKENDHRLLANLLERTDLETYLQVMTPSDLLLIETIASFKAWQLSQEDRKKAEQHAAIGDKDRAYFLVGYGDPLVNIEAVTGDTSSESLDALNRAEEKAKKVLEERLMQLPVYRDILKMFPGIGPSIGARIIVSIGDINRFRKDDWSPEAEIADLATQIGEQFIKLGIKESIDGLTTASALAEAQSVALESLEPNSDLYHHRLHLVYPADAPKKAGQVQTYRLLHVLADKWNKETNTIKADLANETIILLKRKHRLETDLKKLGVEEVRMRKMVAAVQKYLGVFVNVWKRDAEGNRVGMLRHQDWHFGRRQRGVVGGWDPKGRQAFWLIGGQALKDCNRKEGTFGPLRTALSYMLFEYTRRHPEVVTLEGAGKARTKFGPGYRLRAASWQFAGQIIDWLVRSWMELIETGTCKREPFIFGLIRQTEEKYPANILERAREIKTVTAADIAWQVGDPPPPDPDPNTDNDEDEESVVRAEA